jgi:polar amino acid transport system substrate-binding protein
LVATLGLAACSSAKSSNTPGTTAAGGGSSASTVPAKYKSAGLNVAMDATYPPDEFTQGSSIVGLDADLMNAIGKQLGVQVKIVNATFNTIIPGLLDGKFDVGASSFTDTKDREKQVDFVTYFSSGEGFYVNADKAASFTTLDSLCNHTAAVESGTTEETDAQAQGKKCHVNVLSFSDQNQANLAVSSGRADVGFLDSQVAGYVVNVSHGQFKLSGQAFSTAPYGLAIPKNSGLAAPILDAVKALMANGTYKSILSKWGVQTGAITNPVINGATS